MTTTTATTLTTHQQIGFELGRDYARHRLLPPSTYATEPSPLRDGLVAGRALFGHRTLEATPAVQRWLQLRLSAWLRGRSVELMQVTPNFLQQIEVTHCPVTRAALTPLQASIDRVRNDAGYAAGNLATLSAKANRAKGAHDYKGALQRVRQIESGRLVGIEGLTAPQWSRVAVLCSFVTPMSHEEASALPLLMLPPNRLRLFNPVQALQAFVCRQLLKPGWSQRASRFEALLPGQAARRAFQMFFHALLPRVMEAGRSLQLHEATWAIEDAWRHPMVIRRWTSFARMLTAAQCEALVTTATAKQLGTTVAFATSEAQSVEGWHLATRGYVPHALVERRAVEEGRHEPRQATLPL